MLIARNANGELIQAYQASKQKGKNVEEYYCPACKGKLVLKKGNIMIAHFAHHKQSDCAVFSEGETLPHLKGKQLLLEKFRSEGISVTLECWLPELQQRPDLLLVFGDGKKIAVEYQCSPISPVDLMARTQGYQRFGYEVWWICGMNYQPGSIKMTQAVYQFLNHSVALGSWICILDTQKEEMAIHHHLKSSGDDRFHFGKTLIPLDEFKFACLENLYRKGSLPGASDSGAKTCGQTASRKHMQAKDINLLRYRTDPEHRKFLLAVYLDRKDLYHLPAFLFELPCRTLGIRTPAYIWRYYLLREFSNPETAKPLTKKHLLEWLSTCKRTNRIRIRVSMESDKELLWEPLLHFMMRLVEDGHAAAIGKEEWILLSEPLNRNETDHHSCLS
nr:competence protein CoiA family protein [uncultured Trichococcus sp.]